MKKLFIFDFDGTLMNTIPELTSTMNKALEMHDFPTLSLNEYKNAVNGNVDEVISNLLGIQSTKDNIATVKKSYLELVKIPHADLAQPFNGMHEVLLEIQANDRLLAINSNRYTKSIKNYTSKFFSDVTFSDIQGHNPPNPSKPDAYGVNMILENTQTSKQDAIFIGDSSTDIQTARNAGVDCVLVNWGYSSSNELDDDYPLKVVVDPSQILELL